MISLNPRAPLPRIDSSPFLRGQMRIVPPTFMREKTEIDAWMEMPTTIGEVIVHVLVQAVAEDGKPAGEDERFRRWTLAHRISTTPDGGNVELDEDDVKRVKACAALCFNTEAMGAIFFALE